MGGAVGVGLALVVGPIVAMVVGLDWFDQRPGTSLPVMALLGITVLVGALAMTSTLFRRLGLARRSQPLGLPPGSVRATVALALIVLFAIIAAGVLHPRSEPVTLHGVTAEARAEMQRDPKVQVLGVVADACQKALSADQLAAATQNWKPTPEPCTAAELRYTVTLKTGPDPATLDLAKQLLQMIGGLMTTTVSFYFAARSLTAKAEEKAAPAGPGQTPPQERKDPEPLQDASPKPALQPKGGSPVGSAVVDGDTVHEHLDGCNVAITSPTADHELPAAKGGVAST